MLHSDAHRIMALVLERSGVILGAHLRVAHVLQKYQAVRRVLHDEPAHDPHRDLIRLLRVGRRLAELSGRNLDVLLLERIHHVGCGQVACSQAHRIEPHAHGVLARAKVDHVAHARHALQRVDDVDVQVVGDVFARVAPVARKESGA